MRDRSCLAQSRQSLLSRSFVQICCPNNTFNTKQAFALTICITALCLCFTDPSGLGMNTLGIVGIVALPLVVISPVACYFAIKKYGQPADLIWANS